MDLHALEAFIVAAKRASYVGGGERAHFRGREAIEVAGVEAYALEYLGGLVKP